MNAGKVLLVVCTVIVMSAWNKAHAQQVGIRTNALYWLTTTPNAGIDVRVGRHSTVGLTAGYNPFLFPSYKENGRVHNPKLMHWLVVPEYKYWFCRPYERWFVGLYGIYGKYNVEGMPFFRKKDRRYKGWAAGGGISLGYQWALGKHWGIEVSGGLGYMYLDYRMYECGACGDPEGSGTRHWIGPDRLAVSFSYYIH